MRLAKPLRYSRVCLFVVVVLSIMACSTVPTSFDELKGEMNSAFESSCNAENTICYEGYSKQFRQTKKLMMNSEADITYEKIQASFRKPKNEPGLLFSLESALIALDMNKLDEAVKQLAIAEKIIGARDRTSHAGDLTGKSKDETLKFIGFSESGPYEGQPYERILMLNYKSIAHMLKGERAAYNVTRRAIVRQNMEKKAFDIKMAKVKKQTNQKVKEVEEKEARKNNSNGEKNKNELDNIFSVVAKQYEQSKSQAMQVPSAFVNPFGFYMAGMVQEFDSFEDKNLRDNARISYKKALELNSKSDILKQALKEIGKPAARDKRLTQIIVADGFVPEKKVVKFDYYNRGKMFTLKLPFYDSVTNKVDRVEVQTVDGKRLATLSTVADIEALVMRYQMDSLAEQYLRVALDIVRATIEADASGNMFQEAIRIARNKLINPDTRSWMTMPKRIMASRLVLPKETTDIQIVSYDAAGNVLAKKSLSLDKNNHNFVYVRTMDKIMNINQSDKMWVALK